jgi:hypothetical protein
VTITSNCGAGTLVVLFIGPVLGCSGADMKPSGNGGSSVGGSSAPSTGSGGRVASGGAAGISSPRGGSSGSKGSGGSSSGMDASSIGGTAAGGSSGGSAGSSSAGGARADGGGDVDGAAASGAGGAPAAAGCAGKTYKLCEDFETGTVGKLPTGWTQYNGFGPASPENAALATDQVHSGKMSLKTDDLGLKGAARAMKSLAGLGDITTRHWGRIFYKAQVPDPKPTSGVIHTTWVTLLSAEGTNHVVDTVEATSGMHQWIYNRTDSCSAGSPYNWKYDNAWHCAEWYVDGPASTYRFFSDSTEVTSIDFTGKTCTKVSNGYTAVIVGSTTYQTPLPGARIIWFDDLAIDDNRIGCN